ncbi:carbohydrate porin [Psychromonas sp. PT13]|uniref:carbohydrate porin n=1 Tax=Psychromonas sp. PT13 TaxID=3439547 RepID=UPI003EB76FE4
MKLSKITLACLLATSGLGIAHVANAAASEDFEFHGSFRAGVLTSSDDEYQRNNWVGTKEMLGRLGIESDNDFGVNLSKRWNLDNDQSVKITVDVVEEEDDYSASNFPGAFIEYKGITDTGTIWGGKRDYKKSDNYIFMTDFFYVDYSGTGVGIDGYQVGDAKISVAYMASDRSDDDDYNLNDTYGTNNLMHAFIFGVDWGSFKLDMAAKYMNDNRSYTSGSEGYWNDTDSVWVDAVDGYYTNYTERGADISATYSMPDFFGLPGNGFSKIIAQAGIGLGSQQLLGGTLTTYNGYRPGSVMKGGASGVATMANNYDKDTSARLLLWGGYFLDNGINLFPSIQAQYNNHEEEGTYDYWMSAMIRPTFPVADNFYIQTEVGYAYKNWDGSSWIEQKLTIAPTIVMGTGSGPAPEVRFLASYLPQSDDNIVFGVQADVWW